MNGVIALIAEYATVVPVGIGAYNVSTDTDGFEALTSDGLVVLPAVGTSCVGSWT